MNNNNSISNQNGFIVTEIKKAYNLKLFCDVLDFIID